MALGRRARNALTDTLRLIGDLTPAANLTIYFPNATEAATTTLTAYARTLIASADDAAARVIMKLGPNDAVEFSSLELSDGLSMNGSKVTDLGVPTSPDDAATKDFVDTSIDTLRDYVDTQDEAGRDYTDQQIDTLRDYVDTQDTADRAYTDQEVLDLKSYVDTQNVADRAYTDLEIAELRAYVDSLVGGTTGYDFIQSFTFATDTSTLTLSNNIVSSAVSHQVVLNGRIMRLGVTRDYTVASGGGAINFNYSLSTDDVVVVYGKKVTT